MKLKESRIQNSWTRPALLLPVLVLCAFLAVAAAGCRPKESASKARDTVAGYAKDVGDAAGRLTTKAGEKLGLVEKRYDYVRRAWGSTEKLADPLGAYTLEEEREVGRALAAEVFKRYGHYENERLDRYLNLIAAGLCSFSARPALPCCVGVLRSDELASFGLPGGYLLVTLGSVRACESESEVAGLLAFALAQVNLRHALAHLRRLQAGLQSSLPPQPVTEAEDRDFSTLIETAAAHLLQDGPMTAEVRACDRAATELLVRMGYEPGGLKAFLARAQMRLRQSGTGPVKDYANFKQREKNIDERLGELHALTVGRSLTDRFRRECVASLPAPLAAP